MEEGAAPDVEMVRPTPSLNPRALILTCAAPQVSLGTTSGGESDAHPPSTHRSLAHRFPSPARTQTTPFIPFLSHSPSPACISSIPSINILSRTVSPSHGTLTPSNPKP